jgi:hypothetical protein
VLPSIMNENAKTRCSIDNHNMFIVQARVLMLIFIQDIHFWHIVTASFFLCFETRLMCFLPGNFAIICV